eukprot:8972665-Alexandrium_andersonii.AAC.1
MQRRQVAAVARPLWRICLDSLQPATPMLADGHTVATSNCQQPPATTNYAVEFFVASPCAKERML